jgi:hypothetical protein
MWGYSRNVDAKVWIIDETARIMDAFFRTLRAMPPDRLEWKPMGEGRSALSQARECAQSPSWGIELLTARKVPEFSQERRAALRAESAGWTLEDCERVCRERTELLFDAIRAFPEEEMGRTVPMPFACGRVLTFGEALGLHLWNLSYHHGQVSYIQTLYGDRELH